MRVQSVFLTLLVPGVCACCLRADTWELPRTKSTESSNKTYRFTTTPGRRMAESIKEQNKRLKALPGCNGRLERKGKNGAYELVWEGELANALAPVTVLVSDSGQYVVTFDDWHSVGRGPNVVVIYGPKGKLIRKLALDNFLSPQEIRRLPISVSSTWWGSGYLDEKQECVVLRIAAEAQEKAAGKASRTQEPRVRLATGDVVKAGK